MFRVLKYFLIVFVFFLVHCDTFLPLQQGQSRSNKKSCADEGSCNQKNNEEDDSDEEDNNDYNDEENNSFFYLVNNTGDTVGVSKGLYKRKIEHNQCMRFDINDLEDVGIGPSRCRWKCPEVCKLCPKDAGYYVMDLFPDSKDVDLSEYNGFKKVNRISNPRSCLKFIPRAL